MAVFHITSNNSRDIAGGSAFDDAPINVPGILIVDANSLKVVEANPAAGQLLNKSIKRLAGRSFPFR